MSRSLRRRLQGIRTQKPDDLAACPPGSRILMSSTAGFANQVRAALAIASAGLTPVVQTHPDYREQVEREEGIDLSLLFDGFQTETVSDLSSRVYRDWIIPPWAELDPTEAAQVYNALNFPGLVNSGRLAHLPGTRARMRSLFDGFRPKRDRAEIAAGADSQTPAIHLRMFGRNYSTRYAPTARNESHGRRYVREAWSDARLDHAATTLARVAAEGGTGPAVAVYTDRHDDPAAVRFMDLARAAGLSPEPMVSETDGATGAMEECLRLSGHRRMVLTSTSSFGHLAALLAEDLDWVISV